MFSDMRALLESNSGDITHAKKKSIDILTDIEDKLGSIKAIIAGLEGYVESLELFYQENENSKSNKKAREIIKEISALKNQIEILRSGAGAVLKIKKDIKRL